jgi:hypothetical protein
MHSLKRLSNSADYASPIDMSMTAETLSIGFEQKLASDLILLVYSSSSYKFKILDDFSPASVAI